MMESMRWVIGLVLLMLAGFAALYVGAGRSAPPALTINQPAGRFIGQTGAVDVVAEAPNAQFTTLAITLEQNGRTVPLFALGDTNASQELTQIDRNHVRISRPLGKSSVPELRAGPARVVVTATRPSIFNLRTLTSTATKDIT